MYTTRTQKQREIREFQIVSVLAGMKLYTRHKPDCKYRTNRNHNKCGCPIWYQHERRRWAAGTNNWDEAMKNAANMEHPTPRLRIDFLTIEKAVEKYLVRQSKQAANADSAPYSDRWLLRDGSKNQPSLLQWAKAEGFTKLTDVSSLDVELLAQHLGVPSRILQFENQPRPHQSVFYLVHSL